jgi:hypothetical protein
MQRHRPEHTTSTTSLLLAGACLAMCFGGGCSPAQIASRENLYQSNIAAARPSPQDVTQNRDRAQKIRRFLRAEAEPELRRQSPRFQIPFLRAARGERQLFAASRDIVVRRGNARKAAAQPAPRSLRSETFFTEEGDFFGAQSEQTINDPRRMGVETVERGMSNSKQAITSAAKLPDDFDYDGFWQAVADRVGLEGVKEFSLYAVQYDFGDGRPQPVLILNLWGPENPLGMPDELPDFLKNRIRLIYDLRQHTWAADNLL